VCIIEVDGAHASSRLGQSTAVIPTAIIHPPMFRKIRGICSCHGIGRGPFADRIKPLELITGFVRLRLVQGFVRVSRER
jgi:hypothetical protein